MQTEEGKEVKPVDFNATSEAGKEESKETEKAKEESETKQPEVEKSEIIIEHTSTAEFVDAPEKPDSEKTPTVAATEIKAGDEVKSSEIKAGDEVKLTEIKPEDEKPSDEKKTEKTK